VLEGSGEAPVRAGLDSPNPPPTTNGRECIRGFATAFAATAITKVDIEWARGVGAAIICGHDYCERFPGVIRAVDEFGRLAQLRGSLWSL
jgi:hypothetical protein